MLATIYQRPIDTANTVIPDCQLRRNNSYSRWLGRSNGGRCAERNVTRCRTVRRQMVCVCGPTVHALVGLVLGMVNIAHTSSPHALQVRVWILQRKPMFPVWRRQQRLGSPSIQVLTVNLGSLLREHSYHAMLLVFNWRPWHLGQHLLLVHGLSLLDVINRYRSEAWTEMSGQLGWCYYSCRQI